MNSREGRMAKDNASSLAGMFWSVRHKFLLFTLAKGGGATKKETYAHMLGQYVWV